VYRVCIYYYLWSRVFPKMYIVINCNEWAGLSLTKTRNKPLDCTNNLILTSENYRNILSWQKVADTIGFIYIMIKSILTRTDSIDTACIGTCNYLNDPRGYVVLIIEIRLYSQVQHKIILCRIIYQACSTLIRPFNN